MAQIDLIKKMHSINAITPFSVLSVFEGLKLKVYKDSEGLPTIGVGHLLLPDEKYEEITIQTCKEIFEKDWSIAIESCYKLFDEFKSTNEYQKIALGSLVFNIGYTKFATYKKTIDLANASIKSNSLIKDKTGTSFIMYLNKDKKHTQRRQAEEYLFQLGK